jgi:hypothetical protein
MSEQFWLNNPSVLFSPSTWQKFVPTKDMDVPSALNSIVRFTVYFSVLLYMGTGNTKYLLPTPIVLITTVFFVKLFPTSRDLIETFKLSENVITPTKRYTNPTPENPFMNPLLTEILDNPDRPDAAPITDNKVKKQIEESFQQPSELHMDTSDRFDMAQGMRTFHTLQSAKIPNDQDGFLKFLGKGQDLPDTSSAFPSRNAKIKSESYVKQQGSISGLTSSTTKPTGKSPLKSTSTPI